MIKWENQDYKLLFLDEIFRFEEDYSLKNTHIPFENIITNLNSIDIFKYKKISKIMLSHGIKMDIKFITQNYNIYIPSVMYFKKILKKFIHTYGIVVTKTESDILINVLSQAWIMKKSRFPSDDDFLNALFLKTHNNKDLYKKIYFLKKSVA